MSLIKPYSLESIRHHKVVCHVFFDSGKSRDLWILKYHQLKGTPRYTVTNRREEERTPDTSPSPLILPLRTDKIRRSVSKFNDLQTLNNVLVELCPDRIRYSYVL